jgi:chromosome segregation ATPase
MATAHQKDCKNDIYSELNYEQQRKKNLDQIEELYQKILDQYSSAYQTYLLTNQNATADPSSPDAQNNADRNQVALRPKIKELNKQLIDIETEVLNNNKNVRLDIEEQKRQLKKESSQKNMIGQKLDKIEQMINDAETRGDTGTESVKELKEQVNSADYWYYILLAISGILFCFFVIAFWQVL